MRSRGGPAPGVPRPPPAHGRAARGRGAPPRATGPRPRTALLGHAQSEPLAASGRPQAVARLVGDDRQQPGPQRRALAEASQRAVCLDEGVLRSLLGVRRGAGDHPRGPERDLLVCPHDLLVGVALAPLGPRDELLLSGWPVLHRARTTTPGSDRFQPLVPFRSAWLPPPRIRRRAGPASWSRRPRRSPSSGSARGSAFRTSSTPP